MPRLAARSAAWLIGGAVLFGAALVYLVLLALTDEDLANARDDLPLLLLALAATCGFIAWRELLRRQEAAEAERAAVESERASTEHALEQERALRAQVERQRVQAREWARELQSRLAALHEEHGSLGSADDVRELVLRTAISLTEAEKGLLLSRADDDDDGDLDLAAAVGFENDPEESAIAQHFAREVIARDTTVRSNDPDADFTESNQRPADGEIANLVAIPIWIRDRFSGVVICANREGGFDDFDDDVLLALGDHAGAALAGARLRGELRGSFLATVRVLADAIEAKDADLRVHSNDVARSVAEVATTIGLDPRRREELVFASLLHDVGKIGISERILLKPGPLSPEERLVVELHPKIGHRLLEQVPGLRETATTVLHHHERWDGGGYPSRLRGEDTPIEARLVGIADAFSSMLSDRPYRSAMSIEQACAELRRCAGTQFDPHLVRLFVEEIDRRPPPQPEVLDVLARALDDPELAIRRANDERLLGDSAFSIVDNLTLLYGHRYLHDAAGSEAASAQLHGRPFTIFIVCLDELSALNRDRGYTAGDDALRAAADAVQRVAARCGGTAARESGRRIALLVPGADTDVAGRLARDLELELVGQEASVRWAVWQRGDSGDDVIARARGDRATATLPS